MLLRIAPSVSAGADAFAVRMGDSTPPEHLGGRAYHRDFRDQAQPSTQHPDSGMFFLTNGVPTHVVGIGALHRCLIEGFSAFMVSSDTGPVTANGDTSKEPPDASSGSRYRFRTDLEIVDI